MPQPRIAIIYLSFHCEPYLDDVMSALKKLTYPKDRLAFVVVDNPHPEYGSSVRYLEEKLLPLSGKEIPQVVLLPQKENLGFAGGNNAGIEWAIDNGYDYVYFHNNDGFMAANALEPLVKAMENDKTIGEAQSLLLMHPETNLINTAGNSFHYLGFGFCGNFRVSKDTLTFQQPAQNIGYASGAALLMRVDLLKRYGLWDKDYFLYHEDLEYTMRLRAVGYRPALAPDSIFYHKYSFGRNKQKYYYMERNRHALMLTYFKWPTLILFLPMELLLEVGLVFFAVKNGWIKEKLAVYKYWFNLKNWQLWLAKRKNIQATRTRGDRVLLRSATGAIIFDENSMRSPVLKYLGNPLMNLYWQVVKRVIFW